MPEKYISLLTGMAALLTAAGTFFIGAFRFVTFGKQLDNLSSKVVYTDVFEQYQKTQGEIKDNNAKEHEAITSKLDKLDNKIDTLLSRS